MLPAAFEQLAVRVTTCVSVGAEGDAETEQLNMPGAEGLQASVKFPPPLSVSEKELQLLSERVKLAACDGDDAGTARRARVAATAASVHAAARKSERFIFDSQAERRSGGPVVTCKFRASNYNENN
jgi:hypothetical protein